MVHLEHSGLSPALNAGLEECRAPFVARMDADDIIHPRRLEYQLRRPRPRSRNLGVVSSLVRHFRWSRVGEGFRIYEGWLNSLISPSAIARERFVESPSPTLRRWFGREIFEAAGGYRDFGVSRGLRSVACG